MSRSKRIIVNGRFLSQPFSGVQRFAFEITRALFRQWPQSSNSLAIVAPRTIKTWDDFPIQRVGLLGGQLWEQLELARFARSSVLLNLGNTAPIMRSNQLVVLHDTGTRATPGSYSAKVRLWYRVLHTLLVRSQTRFVTVSEFARQELARNLLVPPERVAVIGEGADHIVRTPADPSILQRYGLSPASFALTVGNLAKHKNLSALTLAADALASVGKSLVIIGCGDAPIFNAESNLPNPALYLGRVTDAELRALYEAAICLMFPSHYEGFGLPVAEAMMCGCPVIASDIPALRELCGDAALFSSPFAPAEFARAVIHFSDNQQARENASYKGRLIASQLTWNQAARKLIPHLDCYLPDSRAIVSHSLGTLQHPAIPPLAVSLPSRNQDSTST